MAATTTGAMATRVLAEDRRDFGVKGRKGENREAIKYVPLDLFSFAAQS